MVDAVQTLSNTKNDLIIGLVQKELAAKTNLLPFITDLSSYAGKGVGSFNVPKLSSFTVSDRAFGSTVDAQALTDAKDTLSLDKNAYVRWIEDGAEIYQSTIEYRIEASTRAAGAMGRYVDAQIIAMLTAKAAKSVNGATAADISVDDILEMRAYLLGKNGDITKFCLAIGVDQEAVMLKLPEFVRADYYGSSNIPNGMIGRVYGVPVIINNQITTQQAYMFEKDGAAIAFQAQPNMAEQANLKYGTLGKEVAVDCVFGVAGLQLGSLGVTSTLSPLIAKLKD